MRAHTLAFPSPPWKRIRIQSESTWTRRKEEEAANTPETTPAPLSQHRFGRGDSWVPVGSQGSPSGIGYLGLFPSDRERRKP